MGVFSKIITQTKKCHKEYSTHRYAVAYINDTPNLLTICEEQSKNGDQMALGLLGRMYFFGEGVKQDKAKSYSYLKRIDKPFSTDAVLLGLCYLYAYGCIKSYSKAKDLINNNLFFCDPKYMFEFASASTLGEDLFFSNEELYILYSVASAEGITEAADRRDQVERDLPMEELDRIQKDASDLFEWRAENPSFLRKDNE